MSASAKERFQRPEDLVAALLVQTVVGGDPAIAEKLASEGELIEYSEGQQLIVQGSADRDIFFILLGSATVIIKGSRLYPRKRGSTVGEMSAMNHKLLRSATMEAAETTVVWKVSSLRLNEIADAHPMLWKRLAIEITDRLEQRNALINRTNKKPKLFIVCSKEAMDIARAIRVGLERSEVVVTLWSDQEIFESGSYPLESLEREVLESDFALALAEPDDLVRSRDLQSRAPRDNVIFELGFFMSRLGRGRTLLLVPRGVDVKLPSDFKGLTPIGYVAEGKGRELAVSLGATIDRVHALIQEKGPRCSLLEAK